MSFQWSPNMEPGRYIVRCINGQGLISNVLVEVLLVDGERWWRYGNESRCYGGDTLPDGATRIVGKVQ